ncbi:hypothetical protein J1N35_006790 [Gossypium stocksii]|uniref:Uncharacterized protein n=1 Tax=Gossypium stocksii TaxID=47602 RepID=A0A9D4ACV0_9ROSI|nr:hypothetical protein J1N35_006790 [Gossypium stocksii]
MSVHREHLALGGWPYAYVWSRCPWLCEPSSQGSRSWQAGSGQSMRDKTLVGDNTFGCWESGQLLSGRHFEDFFQRSRPTLNKTVIVVVLEFKGCCVSLFSVVQVIRYLILGLF